jgi:transcription factor IIIB subunit 2
MNQLAQQLHIQESTVTHGVQILKLAVMNNFIQGRRTEMVCAVCLYTACRMTQPCRVMLIDFADKISVSILDPRCISIANLLVATMQCIQAWSNFQGAA